MLASRALASAQRQLATEVAATKVAWPLVANGLQLNGSATRSGASSQQHTIQAAATAAAQLKLPELFQEHRAASITGPASSIASLFRGYSVLSMRGWQMILNTVEQVEHGSPTAARFARATVNLYIDTVYDAHFSVAQIGKQLAAGYEKLGGPIAFGSSLTQDEVNALAAAYSEASDRLYPHPSVKLGS